MTRPLRNDGPHFSGDRGPGATIGYWAQWQQEDHQPILPRGNIRSNLRRRRARRGPATFPIPIPAANTAAMSSFFTDPATLDHMTLDEGSILAPRFDANGLVTAIAQDATNHRVLMLAFMNEEALRLTIETGVAHYYSRSRGKLWKKGESSGELQRVVELRVDCDQDAILLLVEQQGRGAACHTGRESCFYRIVTTAEGRPALSDSGEPRLFDPAEVYGGHK
jgi:phosphoribosyl-AMP cyclohydrolase